MACACGWCATDVRRCRSHSAIRKDSDLEQLLALITNLAMTGGAAGHAFKLVMNLLIAAMAWPVSHFRWAGLLTATMATLVIS